MQLKTFKLERYFAEHEFTARHLLSASDCESMTLPELLALADDETRGLWEQLWLGYTESQGHPLLREEIAGLYAGLDARRRAGGRARRSDLHPDERAARAGRRGRAHVAGVPVARRDRAFDRLQGRALAAARRERRMAPRPGRAARVHHAAAPGSSSSISRTIPRATCPTVETWEAIVGTVGRARHHALLRRDVPGLEYDEAQRLPSACEAYEKAVTLSGLSKSFGLPGLRIGWLATRDRDASRSAGEIKDYTTICSSAPSEVLGIVALRAREPHRGAQPGKSCGRTCEHGRALVRQPAGRRSSGCRRWPGRSRSRGCGCRSRRWSLRTRRCASVG